MSLAVPLISDNGLPRPLLPGDTLASCDRVDLSAVTVGNMTLLANQVIAPILWRTGPTAGYADTTPDSNTWLGALLQQTYIGGGSYAPLGVPVGFAYRVRWMNTVAFANTVAAGTNVSLAGTTAIPASQFRDYLVTVLNGTPQQIFAATTTNASAIVTGLSAAQTVLLSPGMAVSGAGISGGTTVLSVQPGVGVTLSANATATASLVALTFNPRIELRGLGTGAI